MMLRRNFSRLLLIAAGQMAALVVEPAAGQSVGPFVVGSGGAPSISNLTGTAITDDAVGTAIVTPIASGLAGCAWSIAANGGYFAQASGGAVTKANASVPVGSYTPATSCSRTAGGQTVIVSASLAISITLSTSYSPSLDFSDARNSQYL